MSEPMASAKLERIMGVWDGAPSECSGGLCQG